MGPLGPKYLTYENLDPLGYTFLGLEIPEVFEVPQITST